MKYILGQTISKDGTKKPRHHLSWSSYSLWRSSQNSYRKKYYEGEPPFETVETLYGKTIANKLEKKDHVHDDLIIQKSPEYRMEVNVGDKLKLLGYLDSFDEETKKIVEYKTGHVSKDGKSPWNNLKVRKHKQLVFYSLLSKLKFGEYNPDVILQWLETEFMTDTKDFKGHLLEAPTRSLQMTGRIETFNRNIEEWELDNLFEDIKLAAEEINKDFEIWKKNQK